MGGKSLGLNYQSGPIYLGFDISAQLEYQHLWKASNITPYTIKWRPILERCVPSSFPSQVSTDEPGPDAARSFFLKI
jgi:hypothetical protein